MYKYTHVLHIYIHREIIIKDTGTREGARVQFNLECVRNFQTYVTITDLRIHVHLQKCTCMSKCLLVTYI